MTVGNDFKFLNADKITPSNRITFMCGDKEMIRLETDGNIYVKGNLAENDLDVVEGLRNFLRGHKYIIICRNCEGDRENEIA